MLRDNTAGCRPEEGKDKTYWKKTLAEGRDMCHSKSSYLSSRRFLFWHAGVMLEVKINHWFCFHGTCIVNILILWTITWSWRQKWAKRCTFRDKWHAHTFLYRCFFLFHSLSVLTSWLLWPLGFFVLQRMTKWPHSHQENWSSNCKL